MMRRIFLLLISLLLLGLILGCQGAGTESESAKNGSAVSEEDPGGKDETAKLSTEDAKAVNAAPRAASLESVAKGAAGDAEGVAVTQDLSLGENRFAAALLNEDENPVRLNEPQIYFSNGGKDDRSWGPFPAKLYTENLEGKEIYVATLPFGEAGPKQGLVLGKDSQGEKIQGAFEFSVGSESSTPEVGAEAIPSDHPTEKEKGLAELCTRVPACSMHKADVAETLAKKRPAVIIFATPKFCTSKMCAPVLDNALALVPKYGQQAEFIHIEIYRDNKPPEPAPAVLEWNLRSEPWIFLVNNQGKIAAKFEGPVTTEELDQALTEMLKS